MTGKGALTDKACSSRGQFHLPRERDDPAQGAFCAVPVVGVNSSATDNYSNACAAQFLAAPLPERHRGRFASGCCQVVALKEVPTIVINDAEGELRRRWRRIRISALEHRRAAPHARGSRQRSKTPTFLVRSGEAPARPTSAATGTSTWKFSSRIAPLTACHRCALGDSETEMCL